MVRLWGLEACAHGAEVMSYFRYRQAPFAQEQMHTGLCISNGAEDVAAQEVRQLSNDLAQLQQDGLNSYSSIHNQTKVAIVFDYAGDQAQRIQQPDGKHFDPLVFTQRVYAACRSLSLDVDIVRSGDDLDRYELILLPLATIADPALKSQLNNSNAQIVLFPRSGSKSPELHIPSSLPPAAFQSLIELRVVRTESLPPAYNARAMGNQRSYTTIDWREQVETSISPQAMFNDGWGFHYQHNNIHYINACPTQSSLIDLVETIASDGDIATFRLDAGVRTTALGQLRFVFNYGPTTIADDHPLWEALGLSSETDLALGTTTLPPADVAVWKQAD